jgi:hypothetical protein
VTAKVAPAAFKPRTTATVRVRRGRSTRGTLRVTVPHGARAGRYKLSLCVGRACRTAGTFTLRAECGCVRPGTRPAAPATPASPTTPTPAPAAPVPAPGGPTPVDPPAAPGGNPSAAPDPLDVDPTLDTAHAVTATIDPTGGTLQTTGADGTHYRLDVPPGGVLGPVAITLTPLAKVDGLPFSGGLVAGAALAPDGLQFANPARLTITGAPAVDPARETPFGYRGDGHDLAMTPLVMDPELQAFDLYHFSSYGIASATEAERRAQLIRETEDVTGRLQQILAFEIEMSRWHELTGLGRPLDVEIVHDAEHHYHKLVLLPLMQAALDDLELAPRAMEKFLSWDRQIRLLLGDDYMKAEREHLGQLLDQLLLKLAERLYAKCHAGDPGALPLILAWSRQISLMGESSPARQRAVDEFAACAHFEVDLETTVAQTDKGDDPEQTFHGHLTATAVPLQLAGGFSVMGSGPWQQDRFTITPAGASDHGCWFATSGFAPTGTATLGPLELGVNWIEDADGQGYHLQDAEIADVGLTIPRIETAEEVHWGFCGSSTGHGGTQPWLGLTLDQLHDDERQSFQWRVQNWTRPSNSGPLVLVKHYLRTKTINNEVTTEDTRIVLRHTPQAVN